MRDATPGRSSSPALEATGHTRPATPYLLISPPSPPAGRTAPSTAAATLSPLRPTRPATRNATRPATPPPAKPHLTPETLESENRSPDRTVRPGHPTFPRRPPTPTGGPPAMRHHTPSTGHHTPTPGHENRTRRRTATISSTGRRRTNHQNPQPTRTVSLRAEHDAPPEAEGKRTRLRPPHRTPPNPRQQFFHAPKPSFFTAPLTPLLFSPTTITPHTTTNHTPTPHNQLTPRN